MATLDKDPIYNLNIVLHETGLKADLVRVWESRYGLPKPKRSAGGHRLYSQYDIGTLKWLKEKQSEGFSISNAAQLWKSIANEGKDPLNSSREETPQRIPTEVVTRESLIGLRNRWISASTNFESSKADEVLNLAFSTHSVERVVSEILQGGMREIGEGWYKGTLSVQQEHFASSIAERHLQTLLSLTPPPIRSQTILLGCPPGEMHVLPVITLELLLRRKGYNVIFLGADIPVEHLLATVSSVHPDLVVLAAQTLNTAASLMEAFTSLQASGTTLAYGGLIFNRTPDLRNRIPANFLGEDLDTAQQNVESLLNANFENPVFRKNENGVVELQTRFQDKRAAIELFIQESMRTTGLPIERINDTNCFFSEGLLAALKLGNPAYLEVDLDWVRHLLNGRRIDESQLKRYIQAFRHAVGEYLGADGAALTQWLDTLNN